MDASSAGSVVLVPFPFSDLSESKLRPAVILAEISRDDFVCCQVTSNPYADPNAVELAEEDFTKGSLKRVSYARPGKSSRQTFSYLKEWREHSRRNREQKSSNSSSGCSAPRVGK